MQKNVTTRLIHMMAEFNMLKMICYHHLKDEDAVVTIAKESITTITRAIKKMKEDIIQGWDISADLHRLTFLLFILQFYQEFANYQVEDPMDLASRDLPEHVVNHMQKMKFLEHTRDLVDLGLADNVAIFLDLPLSQILSPFRLFILNAIEP